MPQFEREISARGLREALEAPRETRKVELQLSHVQPVL